jgi:hypothetical protein
LPSITEEEIKTKQKLKQFMTTQLAPQKYSKESYSQKRKINVAMKI